MISTALVIRYAGDVTLKYSARRFRVWLPLNAAIVPGTMMSDWAKMMGITFAVLRRSGMKVFCPSRIRPRPMTLRGIWMGIRRAAMVMATTAAMTATRMDRNSTTPGAPEPLENREGDEEAHPVPDAALGDLLAQPHDEDGPRGEGHHHDEPRGQ